MSKEVKTMLTVNDAFNLANTVNLLLDLPETVYEFNDMLIDVDEILADQIKVYERKFKKLLTEMKDLSIKYCAKDSKGKPIILKDRMGRDNYTGLATGTNPEYDKRINELEEQKEKLEQEELPFDFSKVKKISKSVIPEKGWKGIYQKQLKLFIKD